MQVETKRKITILRSDEIGFKPKMILRDREGHYIMTKDSLHQKDTTIMNIYACNIGVPQHIRQMLRDLQGKMDNTLIIGGYFFSKYSTYRKG